LVGYNSNDTDCTAGETRELILEGDCKEMIEAEGHFIDGLEWCKYTTIVD